MLSKKTITLGLAFLGLAALLLFLELVNLPGNSIFWAAVSNWGHVPLFGVFSLLVLFILKSFFKQPKNHILLYLAAGLITSVIGMLSEIVQIYSPRDADVWDLARDVLGATIFLGIYASFDKKLKPFLNKNARKKIVRLILAVMFLATFIPIANSVLAIHARNEAFPVMAMFEHNWEKRFIGLDDARLELVEAPSGWPDNHTRVGRITFEPADFPHLEFMDPVTDWLSFDYLEMSIFSPYDSLITLYIRIEDVFHDQTYEDRYQGTLLINPGVNNIALPTEEIRHGPANRDLDMTAISSFQIYAYQPKKAFTLYFDNIALVP